MTDDEAMAMFARIINLEAENDLLKKRVADLEAFATEKTRQFRKMEYESKFHDVGGPAEGKVWFTLTDEELRELGVKG